VLRLAIARRRCASTVGPQTLTPADIMSGLTAAWPEQCSHIVCDEVSRSHALLSYNVPADVLRPGGFISGPAQFTLCDLAMWCACFGVLDRIEPMALTSELSIRFVRPAVGTLLRARTDVCSVSGRSIVSSTVVWTDENASRPCSIAQGTYVLPR
jgi:acyl-coenzyme A thioesterase PaaI-like protein